MNTQMTKSDADWNGVVQRTAVIKAGRADRTSRAGVSKAGAKSKNDQMMKRTG